MYKESGNLIVKVSTGSFIPQSQNSQDYLDYLAWLDQGNTPEQLLTIDEQRLSNRALIQSQLNDLEAGAFMRRGQREYWLAAVSQQMVSSRVTHEQAYAANPEYKRVFDENQTATALRNQLRSL